MLSYDYSISSPLSGKVVPLSKVSDIAFSTGTVGIGVAIEPTEGKVYAPFDCIISTVFYTNNIIGISSENGLELMIHIGIDTIKLDGHYFHSNFFEGDKASKGDLLIDFDIDAIKKNGFSIASPVVVINGLSYNNVFITEKEFVDYNDDLIFIKECKLSI